MQQDLQYQRALFTLALQERVLHVVGMLGDYCYHDSLAKRREMIFLPYHDTSGVRVRNNDN
jgi:hypothetical protein